MFTKYVHIRALRTTKFEYNDLTCKQYIDQLNMLNISFTIQKLHYYETVFFYFKRIKLTYLRKNLSPIHPKKDGKLMNSYILTFKL